MYWLVGLAFAVAIGVTALLRARGLRRLWGRIQDGSKGIDDDWDPFT
jgi:hypothetical protein